MRPLKEVYAEIESLKKQLAALQQETEVFRSLCPHPEKFLKQTITDISDEVGGPPRYEYSGIDYFCSLCEGKFYGNYDKNKEPIPTLEDILNE